MLELTLSQPANASLEAYKAWIRALVAKLGGSDDLAEEEWERGWREFWSDSESPTEKSDNA